MDIKHRPKMPDERQKRYLYVAIDRATRWVYLEIRSSQSAQDARPFMKRVVKKALHHQAPIAAMKDWPELFHKRLINYPALGT